MAVNSTPAPSLTELESRLGYTFARRAHLELALTHRSVAHERAHHTHHPDQPFEDNEQLEFLGDAVVGLIVADELYRRFPQLDEGGLTRMRAFLVSRRYLAEVAISLSLGDHLLLGRGEQQTGGRTKSALLANAMEAILAAIYIDAGPDLGLAAARTVVNRHIIEPALPLLSQQDSTNFTIGDHKSALQQRLQAAGLGPPRYVTTGETGPDHNKHFTVEVRIESHSPDASAKNNSVLASASAGSKKQAQQAAARIAFAQLDTLLTQSESKSSISQASATKYRA
jgi:ribonuclease-3